MMSRRERPLSIVHVLPTFEVGGLENGVVNLIDRMEARRFRHTLCVLSGSAGARGRFEREVPVHLLQKREGNDPRLPFRIAGLLRRAGADIVRSYGWGAWIEAVTAATLAAVSCRIHSEHGFIVEELREIPWRRRLAQRGAAVMTTRIVAVSDAIREALLQRGIPEGKVTTIINGVDTRRFSPGEAPQVRASLGIPPETFLLGSVARLDPIKDLGSVIRALPDLPGACYLIVGEGPQERELRELSRTLGVAERVRFLGARSDVPEILRALDLFLLPSLKEGTSNTLLEAMATALPIVATAVGGTPALVAHEESAILVPPGRPEAIAAAVERARRERRFSLEVGRRARRVACTRFSLERMVHAYEDLYTEAFEGCRRRGS